MGSLNSSGGHISQSHSYVTHVGRLVRTSDHERNNSLDDSSYASTIANSGDVSTLGSGIVGVVFAPGSTTHTSGISLNGRDADNTVEREKFTQSGNASGVLQSEVTRKIDGIQVSVSTRHADSSLGPAETDTERKIFYIDSDRGLSSGLSDWNIFDSSGDAAGATNGTTDIDITPAATFAVASTGEPVV